MLIDPYHTGYRANHSTQTLLIKLTDDIRQGMDQQRVTLLLFFDFSKASVGHVTLMEKLRKAYLTSDALK